MIKKIANNQPKKSDKNWLIVFLVVAVITVLTSVTFNIASEKGVPTKENTWNTATPGYEFSTSTQEKLGAPLEIKNTELGKEYNYRSNFPTYNTTVLVSDNNEVLFIKERLSYNPEHTLISYTNSFGEPQLVLNYPRISHAVKAHIFLNKGLVVFSHISDGSVEAIWYFKPTTEEKFLEYWGKDLTSKGSSPETF